MLQELSVKKFCDYLFVTIRVSNGYDRFNGRNGCEIHHYDAIGHQWDYSQADVAPVTIFVKEQINAP